MKAVFRLRDRGLPSSPLGMSPLRCPQIFILILVDVLRHVTLVECGNPSCPRTLHDCNSLEQQLHDSIDVIISPDFMLHVYDYHSIADMCKFFKTPSCSDPVLKQCKGEVIYSSRVFKHRQQNICGDNLVYKDMNGFRDCAQNRHRFIMNCLQKRSDKLEEASYLAHTSSSSDHPWCNITSEYISCVYTVMALGCKVDLADEYMKTVNQSLPVVEAVHGHGCSFGHPLDVLKTTTPPPLTTPPGINRVVFTKYGSRNRSPRHSGQRSTSNGGSTSVLLLVCSVLVSIGINKRPCSNYHNIIGSRDPFVVR